MFKLTWYKKEEKTGRVTFSYTLYGFQSMYFFTVKGKGSFLFQVSLKRKEYCTHYIKKLIPFHNIRMNGACPGL